MGSTRLGPIDSLELRTIQLPLVAPFETSFGTETIKEAVLVILRKDDVAAYGECVALSGPWYSEETITSAKFIIKHFLAPLLFRDDLESPAHFIEMSQGIKGNNMAVAAVEMALWDLQGKLEGRSLSQLIGGTKKQVAVGVSVGIQPSIDRLLQVVSSYLDEGYSRIKIKPGYDVGPTRAIRRMFPGVPLQVDANSSYTLSDAKTLKELDEFDLLLIEQPLGHDDIIDHSKLQKQLSTPICLDESIHTPEDARKAIEIDACRVINIKPGRVRGLHGSKQIHDFCVDRKVPVWCGGMLETGIGRAFNVALASLPGFTLPGDTSASRRYFKLDIITREFDLTKDGTLEVPTRPGIGVEVHEERLNSSTTSKEILTAAQMHEEVGQ
jgi:O-succinylbenzoate synthase